MPNCSKRARLLGALALAPLLLGTPAAQAQSSYEQLQTFSAVLSQIRANYVDSVDTGRLIRAAINGMLRSLDPHSRYVSHDDHELRAAYEQGVAGGTGLALEEADGAIVILYVAAKSPAAKAGIQAGDRLRRLNDSSIAGLSAGDLQTRLLGPMGSKLRLTLERGARLDPDTFAVTVKRAAIAYHPVSAPRLLDRTTGYLRLEEFTAGSAHDLHEALDRMRGLGARQLVLDLRGNPGGSVDAMIDIASMFLPGRREVFHAEGRKKTGLDSVVTRGAGEYAAMPLVLLLDQGSASAAEMLAGTLQDHDRALIVGRRSFGKALMQTSMPLPNGDVVWLTTARIVTPSGRVIQRRYRGIGAEQYYALAGKGGAPEDTAAVWRTEHGRPVRGGGGIVPDVPSPRADLPVWLSVAFDSGYTTTIADSIAVTLAVSPEARAGWIAGGPRWEEALVPLLARVRQRLHVIADPPPETRRRIARLIAMRVAEVRWGPDAAEDLSLGSDGDVRLAVAQFPHLSALLGGR